MQLLSSVINTPVVDLEIEDKNFAGIYTPQSELNKPRMGVSKAFLEEANRYFERFEQFDFTHSNLKRAFDHIGQPPRGLILDLGAGFGNSTIPILRHYADVNVVAADISPNLLAILRALAEQYQVSDRCALVACDLLNDYFKPAAVDMVLGLAILHHLVDPKTLIRSALKTLKPGGFAIFMEPFAEGHFVLRVLFETIIKRYQSKKRRFRLFPHNAQHDKAIAFLKAICLDIYARSARTHNPSFEQCWPNLDDKWMFTRSYFYDAAKEFENVSVDFINLHSSPKPYVAQMRYLLGALAGLPCPDCLPGWAWALAEEYETRYLTPELRENLLIEAIIIMHRHA